MSRSRLLRTVVIAMLVAGLFGAAGALPGSAQTPPTTPTVTPRPTMTVMATPATTTVSQQQPFLLTATLLGIAEVPTPGALTGIGSAAVLVDQGRNMVCYTLHVVNTDFPTAAHIHEGAVDAVGPVVVPFAAPTGENSTGCVSNADAAVVARLMDNPAGFYVNVHTSEFPDGAVRGQLGR
jgi:hypothetical protein